MVVTVRVNAERLKLPEHVLLVIVQPVIANLLVDDVVQLIGELPHLAVLLHQHGVVIVQLRLVNLVEVDVDVVNGVEVLVHAISFL